MTASMPESSSRIRSDSLDDPEHPEQERKRPRLNSSKPDVEEAMADAVPVFPTPISGSPELESSHTRPITPPSSTHSVDTSTATSPTSKVTINTRAPPLHSPHHMPPQTIQVAPNSPKEVTMLSLAAVSKPSNSLPLAGIAGDSPAQAKPISISSSPSGSPEIEVAEVEDYDQDPSQTRWTSVSGTARNPVAQSFPRHYVNQTFPLTARRYMPGTSQKMVTEIANTFLLGNGRDGILFVEVKTWLAQFLDRFDGLEKDFIMEEPHFWREFPELVTNLLKREIDAPAEARPQDLETFFVDYGRLIVLLIRLDLRQLRSYNEKTDPKEISDLFCRPYLSTLTWILQYREIPFYETLLRGRNFNPANLISAVADQLADSKQINILHFLTELSIDIASVLLKKPSFATTFLQLLTAASQFIRSIPERAKSEADAKHQESQQLEDIRENSLQFFRQADELLQKAIIKQAAWLTIENSGDIIRIMSRSMQCLADQTKALCSEIVASAGVNCDGFEFDEDMPEVAGYAWKFKTLRKYVTNGRMEIRVHGIDTMQSDLVYVFNCHIRNNQHFMRHPLVRFLARFIQDTKFIDYIIGVDSHPQIIQRSTNIVGFLCVTRTYTNDETDIMWKTVVESPDPRTSSCVLNLLQGEFNMLELQDLHYLCYKLLSLPIQRFDTSMLAFTAELLENIRQKFHLSHAITEPYESVTVMLCVRLLREASNAVDCSPEQLRQTQHVGAEQLMHLIRPTYPNSRLRVDMQVQSSQWYQIAEEIANNDEFSTGSVAVLHAWLTPMPFEEASQLLTEFDIPKVLIHNIACLSDQYISGKIHRNHVDFTFNVRLDALFYVITRVPEEITSELLETLWVHLFTANDLPGPARAKAWSSLSCVLSDPNCDNNRVVEQIVKDFVPRLRPDDLTVEVLDLIQCCVRFETRKARSSEVSDDSEIVSIPGIERVWQVMLEAPPGTVESHATDFLIRQYLDNDLITKRSKSCVHATHLSLVDRCVRQVISSAAKLRSYSDGTASGEDEPMVIIASEPEILAEEMRFDRSLLFLRKFLQGMQARPRYSPPPIRDSQLRHASFDCRGNGFEAKLQFFGTKLLENNTTPLRLGSSNTGNELWEYLSDVTGFTQFQVICGGKKLSLKGSDLPLGDFGIGSGNCSLLVSKTAQTPEKAPTRTARAASPLDTKVLGHFQELYELLELDERLSSEVFSFLSLFPAQSGILEMVRSMKSSADTLLPSDKPYRLLYCAQALRSCMEDESFSSSPDADFLRYGVTTIIDTFSRLETSGPGDELQMSTAQSLLESLLLGFRAKVPAEVSRTYIIDHQNFVAHLLRMARNGRDCISVGAAQNQAGILVRDPLEALIEGALHDDRVWPHLRQDQGVDEVFSTALLTDSRSEVRKAVAEIFLGLSGSTGAKLVLKVNDPRAARSRFPTEMIEGLLSSIWPSLRNLLPEALSWPFQCQELFDVTVSVVRRIGKSFTESELNAHFQQWSSLLVGYHHKENIGRKVDDYVVWGFTKLLQECCKSMSAIGMQISPNNLANELISNFLFPDLSPMTEDSEQLGMPVLSSNTREDLYELILLLCHTNDDLDNILPSLTDIVAKDHFFEPHLSYDRQSLRSEVGYSGLRNLSNTCYLNSLFSQLFMNVQFRDFLLRTNVVDESRQKLVAQLAKVFAHMQNSYERYIDPTPAVESIAIPALGGQDEQIDVAVQMDVDEFYNILFDQMERQILDPELRRKFKALYGGQLVQQVKSRECEHISERVEPFSNVQIEIKGKRGLEDGLKAYVEGEILQGDNKYSCTSCGKHVDAVKRACLKDVPDNLIFNLKRFDYDIMTGTRCKINDEFQFPDTIDMAPYTVEYLSNSGKIIPADIFELTGVIVHAGTADSGHYYSYIRQRPSSKTKEDSWVQFNDTEVTPFDLSSLRDNCFGGIDMGSAFQWPKIYSAYMLFYQRSSSIKKFEKKYQQHDMLNPVRLPLPGELERHIRQQNELFIRCYSAQDPSHARFMHRLLERIQVSSTKRCHPDHEFESKLLLVALDYIQQVSSRWKELPEFEATVKTLRNNASRCTTCAQTILEWFIREEIVSGSMLRSVYPTVRKLFIALLCQALSRISKDAREAVSESEEEVSGQEGLLRNYLQAFHDLTRQLVELWGDFQRLGRAWNDYFDLLTSMVKLGYDEAWIVLEQRALELVLDLALVHAGVVSKRLKSKYQIFLTLREKNRVYGLSSFIDCLEALLGWLDLKHISGDKTRYRGERGFGVTALEAVLLGLTASPLRNQAEFEWLKKLVIGRHNTLATHRIVRHLIQNHSLVRYVYRVLELGLGEDHIGNAIAFLEPTLIFCSHCTVQTSVQRIVKVSLECVETIGSQYGKEHLEYIYALAKTENEDLGLSADHFEREVLLYSNSWGPVLLIYPSNDLHADVRRDTVDLLNFLIFDRLEAEDVDPQEMLVYRKSIRRLAMAGAQYITKNYIQAAPKDLMTLQAGQASVFFEMMEKCLQYFDINNAREEQQAAEAHEALDALKVKADAAIDTLSSSWQDGESDAEGVSELYPSDMGTP